MKEREEAIKTYCYIALYLLLSLIWHFSTNSPWDDDCLTRYFITRGAMENPKNFIDLWNRPLFTLLFYFPFQLGKNMVLLMALISASGQYAMFKVVEQLKIPNPSLVVPLLAFQAFYFTVSRCSLAEPLAAAVIAWAFYALKNRKFVVFAILGGLLPLARLELAPLLILFFYYLIKEKKYQYVLLLGVPVLLWNIGGYLIEGDPIWLYNQTVGKDTGENKYGHTSFGHYFQRFIFIVGPIVFYYLIIGLLESIYRKKVHFFPTLYIFFAFSIYVLFSWKLNLGHAAGFLRHFITISPMVAFVALLGVNYWMESFAAFSGLRHKEFRNEKNERGRIVRILGIGAAILTVTYLYFSYELTFHHNISENKDYLQFYVILGLIVLPLFAIFLKKVPEFVFTFGLPVLIALGLMSFTLITEPPNAHDSPERQTISKVSDMYVNSFLSKFPTYVNHNTFFWANDLEKESEHFGRINKETLESMPDSSIVVWETHYNQIMNRGVKIEELSKHPKFVELFRYYSSSKNFITVVFQKVPKKTPNYLKPYYDRLIQEFPGTSSLYVNRGNLLINSYKDYANAITDYTTSIHLDSSYFDAVYNRGIAYLNLKNYSAAGKDFYTSTQLKKGHLQANYYLAACLSNIKNYKDAVPFYTEVLKLNTKHKLSFLNRGIAYSNLKKHKEAVNDFTNYLNLDKGHAIAHHYRGVSYLNLNMKTEGCNDLSFSFSKGNHQAKPLIDKYCSQ